MLGRKCFLLNDNVESNDDNPRVPPFGYPELTEVEGHTPTVPAIEPLKMSQLETFVSPGNTFALTDIDHINIPNPKSGGKDIEWWTDLPNKPVHGEVRNELYFDWHVAAKHVDW